MMMLQNPFRATDPAEYSRPVDSGVESMAWIGNQDKDVPWHGLGTFGGDRALTAKEMMDLAGLGWRVNPVPIHIPWPVERETPDGMDRIVAAGGQLLPFVSDPRHRAIQRDTDGRVYGVAKTEYRVVQNADAFKFFDAVVGTGEAKYHTAGSLDSGKRIWLLAKMPYDIEVIPGDAVQPYIMLHTSHEPGNATGMFITMIRVVCRNTARIAIRTATGKYVTPHVGDIMNKASKAREVLGLTEAYVKVFQEEARRLVEQAMNAAEFHAFTLELQGIDPKTQSKDLTTAQKHLTTQLEQIYTEAPGQSLVAGTRWAAFNAVTYFANWEATSKIRGRSLVDARMEKAWFGSGAKMEQRAYDILTEATK